MGPPVVQAIRERGFRKWYERELVRSHVHLVLVLACALAAIGALEAFSQRHGSDRLLMVLSLLVAAGVGAWAVRRYLFHLMLAEQIANQAVCPACQTYARWREQAEGAPGPASADGQGRLQVRCLKCGHEWRIEW